MANNDWQTSLPPSLQNPQDLAMTRMVVTQWSRLVSWSWTPILAFAQDQNKAAQEQILKNFINQTLQRQGQNTYSYESYADEESKGNADKLSSDLKSLFLGNNGSIEFLKNRQVTVTLPEVLQELSGEDFVFKTFPEFTQMFIFRVMVSYTGEITEIVTGAIPESGTRQYIAKLAYPPRPVLSEFTVTEQQLYDWTKNINTGGNYLPPSIYIPIAGS